MGATMSFKITGDQTIDGRYTYEAIGPPSDLAWKEIDYYGTDIEVGGDYLLNRDGTCDYGEISDPSEIESYKVPGGGFNTQAPGRRGAHF